MGKSPGRWIKTLLFGKKSRSHAKGTGTSVCILLLQRHSLTVHGAFLLYLFSVGMFEDGMLKISLILYNRIKKECALLFMGSYRRNPSPL